MTLATNVAPSPSVLRILRYPFESSALKSAFAFKKDQNTVIVKDKRIGFRLGANIISNLIIALSSAFDAILKLQNWTLPVLELGNLRDFEGCFRLKLSSSNAIFDPTILTDKKNTGPVGRWVGQIFMIRIPTKYHQATSRSGSRC